MCHHVMLLMSPLMAWACTLARKNIPGACGADVVGEVTTAAAFVGSSSLVPHRAADATLSRWLMMSNPDAFEGTQVVRLTPTAKNTDLILPGVGPTLAALHGLRDR